MKKFNNKLNIILLLTTLIVGGSSFGIYSYSTKPAKTVNAIPQQKNPPTTPNSSNSHGTVDNGNLSVTAYQNYVKSLGLSQFNKLSSFNNDQLKTKLKTKYPDLEVTILNGSDESTGTLILQFSGTDNGQKISGTSTITGFETYDATSFSLQDIKVNLTNWFSKQLPIIKKQSSQKIDIDKINSNNLLTDLVTTANVVLWKDGNSNLMPLKQALQSLQGLSAQLINKSSNKNNKNNKPNNTYLLQLKPLDIHLKKFDGDKWIESNSKKIIDNSRKSTSFLIPTLSDLKDHILVESNVKSDATFTNYYPSYFKSKWEVSKEITDGDFTQLMSFTNFNEVEKKYNSYLNQEPKTNLSFKVDTSHDGLTADDYAGTLSFRMQLKEEGSNIGTKNKRFQLSRMKKISDFIELKKKETNDFQITKESKLNFYKKILKILKAQDVKNKIINFFNGSDNSHILKIDANQLKATLTSISNSELFFNAEDDKTTWEQKSDKLGKWNDSLWLFNQSLNVNDSATSSNVNCILKNKDQATEQQPALYICNDDVNSAFYLNTLKYTFDETSDNKISLMLTKSDNNNNQINISFNGKTIVGFSDTSKSTEEFNTKFILNNLQKNVLI